MGRYFGDNTPPGPTDILTDLLKSEAPRHAGLIAQPFGSRSCLVFPLSEPGLTEYSHSTVAPKMGGSRRHPGRVQRGGVGETARRDP